MSSSYVCSSDDNSNCLYTHFKQAIHLGNNFSNKLVPIKVFSRALDVALNILRVIPQSAEYIPFGVIDPVLKDTRRFIYFMMTFQNIKFFLENDIHTQWKLTLLNVAGLGLSTFTVIEYLRRLKIDVTGVDSTFKKVPFFGVLRYAGLLSLCNLTINSIVLSFSLERRPRLIDRKIKLQEKLSLVELATLRIYAITQINGLQAQLDEHERTYIEPLVTKETAKTAEEQEILRAHVVKQAQVHNLVQKKQKWERVSELSDEQAQIFLEGRITRLTSKLEKTQLELTSNKLSLISSVVKITAIVIPTFVILAGITAPVVFGVSTVVIISLTLGVIEVNCDVRNYFLKKKISNFQIAPAIGIGTAVD